MSEPNTNPLVEVITEGVVLEALSPDTRIQWDPVNDTGNLSFAIQKYLMVNGEYKQQLAPLALGYVSFPLNDILMRRFAPEDTSDPVTGADLSAISGAGMALLIKAAFKVLVGEHMARIQALSQPPA